MNEAMIVSWAGMGTKIKSEFGYWAQILENLSETSALLSKLFLDTKVYNIRLLKHQIFWLQKISQHF